VLCVSDGITDDLKAKYESLESGGGADTYVLEEDFQYTTSLLVDETRDTLDTTTTGETTNSGLGNSCGYVSGISCEGIVDKPWMLSRRILR
jgi:hypothetical protein